MRYRQLSATGDYTFGQGQSNFFIDVPNAPGQLVSTRLKLLTNEWFLNLFEGTPYSTQVLGTGTKALYDIAIRKRILETTGVTSITTYASQLTPDNRNLIVVAEVATIYGPQTVSLTL